MGHKEYHDARNLRCLYIRVVGPYFISQKASSVDRWGNSSGRQRSALNNWQMSLLARNTVPQLSEPLPAPDTAGLMTSIFWQRVPPWARRRGDTSLVKGCTPPLPLPGMNQVADGCGEYSRSSVASVTREGHRQAWLHGGMVIYFTLMSQEYIVRSRNLTSAAPPQPPRKSPLPLWLILSYHLSFLLPMYNVVHRYQHVAWFMKRWVFPVLFNVGPMFESSVYMTGFLDRILVKGIITVLRLERRTSCSTSTFPSKLIVKFECVP